MLPETTAFASIFPDLIAPELILNQSTIPEAILPETTASFAIRLLIIPPLDIPKVIGTEPLKLLPLLRLKPLETVSGSTATPPLTVALTVYLLSASIVTLTLLPAITNPLAMCHPPTCPEPILPLVTALSAISAFITAPLAMCSDVILPLAIANCPTEPDAILPLTTIPDASIPNISPPEFI